MSHRPADVLDPRALTPGRVWAALDPQTRVLAARAFLAQTPADDPGLQVVEATLARALRFRLESVRRLPRERKAAHLARAGHPDDSLAAALLQALHLGERRPLLAAFLDDLGIRHEDGHIDPEARLEPPAADRLETAAAKLYAAFPPAEVDAYLATLAALDPPVWSGLGAVLERRRGA